MDIADVLKALSDTNRLRILNLLDGQTLCACDLEEVLDLNQSNLSRHMTRLRQAGLVSARKKALFTYYTRNDAGEPYGGVIKELYGSLKADARWDGDRARLDDLLKRNGRSC